MVMASAASIQIPISIEILRISSSFKDWIPGKNALSDTIGKR
jgi:hypothetical protein